MSLQWHDQAPRHTTPYIFSRACHVTSHTVFVWGYTAFDTLCSLNFTLAQSQDTIGYIDYGERKQCQKEKLSREWEKANFEYF